MNPIKLCSLLAVVLCSYAVCTSASDSSATELLAEWVPEEAILCVEMLRVSDVVEPLLRPEMIDRVAGLPAVEQGRQTEGYQGFMGAVRYIEMTTRTNWQSVVRSVVGTTAVWAVCEANRSILIVDGCDPDRVTDLHDLARQLAAAEAQKRGHPERVDTRRIGDVTGWTFDGKEAHAMVGHRILAASDAAVLEQALSLRGGKGGGLAGREDYQAARRAVGDGAIAMAFLDLSKLRGVPEFSQALEAQGGNPLVALLLADIPAVLSDASWLAIGAYVEGGVLSVRVFSGPAGSLPAPLPFIPTATGARGGLQWSAVPRQLGALELRRDLQTFYAAKDTLFPQRTSGLIFFENMMGIFFSGRNLTDEVLSALGPDARLVVARQEYDRSLGIPEPQLPAFALVFELRDPAGFGEVMEEAWQKALGLINFTRGQKALPGLILDRVRYRGIPMTVAAYSSKDVGDRARLDQRFNFRPTLAMAHGAAILSSTDQLAQDVMDVLAVSEDTGVAEATDSHTVLQVRAEELAAALRANREALVRNSMVEEGKTEAEAEVGIDTLLAVVTWLEAFQVEVGSRAEGLVADVHLTFTQP